MTETLKTIMSTRPESGDVNEMLQYNNALYSLFLNGDPADRREARNELLTFNERYFWSLCTTGSFRNIWVQYPLASCEDAVATLQIALISVLEDEIYDKWDKLIWLKTMDRAKEMIHDQYNTGGAAGSLVTKHRIRNNETDKEISVVNDSALDYMGEEKDSIYGSTNPYDSLELKEVVRNFLQEAVDKEFIRDLDREILYLRSSGLSHKDVAAILNIGEDNERQLYKRTINRCRAAYKYSADFKNLKEFVA